MRDLHAEFIRAGARVITINSYAATPERLAREGAPELFEPLQQRAIDLAEAARDSSGAADEVRIAGCLSPLFGSYDPALTISFDETLASTARSSPSRPIASTSCSARRWRPPRRRARLRSPRPRAASPSGCRGRSPMTARRACAAGRRWPLPRRPFEDIPLAARLVNCSRPEAVDAAIPELIALGGTVGAYANAFPAVEALEHGGTVDVLGMRDDLGPARYAEFALRWVDAGAAIVGGCCEVGPEHIAALRDRLAAR